MKLSIITVNWNGGDLLKKCLDSIYKHTQGVDFEIIIVDNGSTQKNADFVKHYPQFNRTGQVGSIFLMQNPKNLGFAKANNQGIKHATGEYVLLLNNDTELSENSFKKMVDFMDSRPECGILGCKLLNSDKTLQRSCRRFPNLTSQILILIKAHNLLPKIKALKRYYMFDFDHNSLQEVDQVMGACFLIRRKVIEQIGILDESFWYWFEEVDYCQRAKNKNWKVFFMSETAIIHHKGASGQKHKLFFRQRKFNQSMLKYFKKHKPLWQWFILWCLQPISWLATLFLQLLFILKIPLVKNKDL